jgi:hypothetical protein
MSDEAEEDAKINYERKPWCGMTAISGWHCSRTVGHSGDHVAWGENGYPPKGNREVMARWPQDPAVTISRTFPANLDQVVEILEKIDKSLDEMNLYLKETCKDTSLIALHCSRQTMLLEKLLSRS